MLQDIMAFLSQGVSACNEWAADFFDAIPGMWTYYLAAFVIYQVVRFLMMPIVGSQGVGSDKVQRRSKPRNGKDNK